MLWSLTVHGKWAQDFFNSTNGGISDIIPSKDPVANGANISIFQDYRAVGAEFRKGRRRFETTGTA